MQNDLQILVADDHGIVRMGLVNIIKQKNPNAIIYEVEDYNSLYDLVSRQRLDLAIVDVKMPNGSFREAMEFFRIKQPNLKILVFSSQDELLYAVRYMKMGADGFLNKNSSREVIVRAIDAMMLKGRYISDELKETMVFNSLSNHPQSSSVESLSDRELQVANKLCEGVSIKEMSDQLHLHASTISTYKNRIFEKLNISSVPELIEVLRMYED